MRIVCIIILTVCIAALSNAQEFYFPKENGADSPALAKSMPELAQQIQDSWANSDRQISLSSKMNLSLLTEQHEEVIAFIDSLRLEFEADYKNGVFVPLIAYAKAIVSQRKSANSTFSDVFELQFPNTYTSLNVASQEIVEANTRISTDNLKQSFYATSERQATSNTLQLASALQLISTYNWNWVYSQASLTMQKIVKENNHKTYDIETTLIETTDGSKLRAHIVKKKRVKGKLPTVFIFNIYADSLRDIEKAKFYAAENYACVVANTKGKGISKHEIAPFEYDGKDAYDVVDWISKQDWSNGEVGMVGGSYLGFTQWATVKKLHPALKTIMPQVSVGPGIDYPMNGNVFMSYMLRWIRYVTNNSTTGYPDFFNTNKWNTLYKKWYGDGSSFRSLDSLEGKPSPVFQRWLNHPAYDSFWQNMVPYKTEFAQVDIPILTTTGYFDNDQMGALYYYKQHHLHNPNANHYLVIGPYTHGGAQMYPQKVVGGYKVDPVARAVNFRKLSVEWFDYVLKGGSKPKLLKDKVNYQVMGTNEWRNTPTLGGMSSDTLTFYFNNTKTDEFYTLSSKPNGNYTEQEVDLADRSGALGFDFKVIRDSITSDISNSVCFISKPFEEPITLSGSFISTIEVAINKKDFDAVIRAYEVMPDGRYFSLFTYSGFSALQRASFAKDPTQRQLLTPNERETIEINTSYITSKQMSKGSRLLIALGVNKSPYWQINYGSGKDVSDETIEDANEPLQVKWYGESFIRIPISSTDE